MDIEYPLNRIPPVVVILCLTMIGVEIALSLAGNGLLGGQQGIGWRNLAIEGWGFSPAVLDRVIGHGDLSVDILKRFVTYPFVHGNFTHAIFAAVLVLALGKFVGEVFHPLALVLTFFVPGIAGAVVYGLVLSENVWLIGAYPPVYGLIGGFTYLMWLRLGQMGANQYRAFSLIGFLLAVQLVFGLLFGGSPEWVADVPAFFTGLAIAPLVGPGGWSAFLARIRRR
jgi:membrane associated rhomboid family serine protease